MIAVRSKTMLVKQRPQRNTSRRCIPGSSLIAQLRTDFSDFAENTSAHGIPRAFKSSSIYRRTLWILLFFGCLSAFFFQAILIVQRFTRNDIVVGVELKFERIPFPAVTICNLNPYKNSLARGISSIQATLKAFDEALAKMSDSGGSRIKPMRIKRENDNDGDRRFVRPIHQNCICDHNTCQPTTNDNHESCLCYSNQFGETWNCHRQHEWINETQCIGCRRQLGLCSVPDELERQLSMGESDETTSCLCHRDIVDHCLLLFDDDLAGNEPPPPSPPAPSRWLVSIVHRKCTCTNRLGDRCRSVSAASDADNYDNLQVVDDDESSRDCICARHDHDSDDQHCAVDEMWSERRCMECSSHGYCAYTDDEMITTAIWHTSCMCHRALLFCIATTTTRYRRNSEFNHHRVTRQNNIIKPIYTACDCTDGDCHLLTTAPSINNTLCICFHNSNNNQFWPCYPKRDWHRRRCNNCAQIGTCIYPLTSTIDATIPCICVDAVRGCIRLVNVEDEEIYTQQSLISMKMKNNRSGNRSIDGNGDGYGDDDQSIYDDDDELTMEIPKFWELIATTIMPNAKEEGLKAALGFEGITDRVALNAKAKENLVFAVASMNESEKIDLSYNKLEFITRCSFNGRQCNVKHDFTLFLDPAFGNCYTFNYNETDNITSERAGPSYGLRIQIFVNISDYLPTTESSGIRLTVHPPEDQPFPDTQAIAHRLDLSAHLAFDWYDMIQVKRMDRLPYPYGDCEKDGKTEDFIYRDKTYSTEGCQRSCVQKYLVNKCGCGDPRFPHFRNSSNCPIDDPTLRECIQKEIIYASRFLDKLQCDCRQPCKQFVYTVSYSAAKWPSSHQAISDCPHGFTPIQCLNYFREQGALIEVYFEQLNYESLLESEAYGLPNLLSDFGGQLGLWMGVSVITVMETLILTCDLFLTIFCCHRREKRLLRAPVNNGSIRKTSPLLGKHYNDLTVTEFI